MTIKTSEQTLPSYGELPPGWRVVPFSRAQTVRRTYKRTPSLSVRVRLMAGHCARCGLKSAGLCEFCRDELVAPDPGIRRMPCIAESYAKATRSRPAAAVRPDELEPRFVRAAIERRQRADAAEQTRAADEARKSRRPKSHRWTEKRAGQLRRILEQVRAGDYSGLSPAAREQLDLIAARPGVTSSRKWTTAKGARVTVDKDALRRHFHRWSSRLSSSLAAAAQERQSDAAYEAHTAVMLADQGEDERVEALESGRQGPDVYAALADAFREETDANAKRDARLDELEANDLEDFPPAPWIAWDPLPLFQVLDGGRS